MLYQTRNGKTVRYIGTDRMVSGINDEVTRGWVVEWVDMEFENTLLPVFNVAYTELVEYTP